MCIFHSSKSQCKKCLFLFQNHGQSVTQRTTWYPTTHSAMDWALDQLLQDHPVDPQESGLIKNDELTCMKNNHSTVDSTDYIDQLHNLLTHSEDTNCVININLPSPPPQDDNNGVGVYADAGRDTSPNLKGVEGGPPGFPSFPPVLSPPEEYRDDSTSPMAVERSMTLDLTYPEEESKSQLHQQGRMILA